MPAAWAACATFLHRGETVAVEVARPVDGAHAALRDQPFDDVSVGDAFARPHEPSLPRICGPAVHRAKNILSFRVAPRVARRLLIG